MLHRLSLVIAAHMALGLFVRCVVADVPGDVQRFVAAHCGDCHSEGTTEGGFDVKSLAGDIQAGDATARWIRAIDRVRLGEMPPKDSSELKPAERQAFVKQSGEWLSAEQRRIWAEQGRVRGRRLTNLQIEKTLHDLLGIDIPLADQLPEEPRTEGFTTVADGQPMSHFQLERHLAIVDLALDEAFRRALVEESLAPQSLTARMLARRRLQSRVREPELLDEKAVTWSSSLVFYGRLPVTTARQPGWYRLTVEASSLNAPEGRGVWCSARTGRCVSSSPLLNWAGSFEATAEPNSWTFEAWLERGDMFELRPADRTLRQARFNGGQVGTGEGGPQNVPGLALHSATLQKIHRGPDRETVYRNLFGAMTLKSNGDWRTAKAWTKKPDEVLARLIKRLAVRAFRRPVEDSQVEPYIELARQELADGAPFVMALRAGFRALFCSPRFLYFHEKPGRLDQFALASRLSYFLWNSLPDAELMKAAEGGKLTEKWQIRKLVERMLVDDRGRDFVRNLAAEWLDLSLINFTEPDRRLYRDFDIVVQQSMLDETHTYLQTMLDEALSVTGLIDSDYTFLNSRLARYYGIGNVAGGELQRVSLEPESHRGGVLTQGAILKVTANGTNTSPVVRGVWVAERLLGEHIQPPPESVPAIEPDIRGAKTIREQLEKHRSTESCASCHRTIDPPGFALENFDPSGKWRNTYLKFNRGKRVKGLRIDAGYALSDGRKFQNVDDFQRLVVARPQKLAANVAEKLLTCGTGCPVTFADRTDIQRIVQRSAESGFGFRSILTNVILSEAFQSK